MSKHFDDDQIIDPALKEETSEEASLNQWFEKNRRTDENADQYDANLRRWTEFKKRAVEIKLQSTQDAALQEAFNSRQETMSRQIAKNVISSLRYAYNINEKVATELNDIIRQELHKGWEILDGLRYSAITDDLTLGCKKHLKAYSCMSTCWSGGWHVVYNFSAVQLDIQAYIAGLAESVSANNQITLPKPDPIT